MDIEVHFFGGSLEGRVVSVAKIKRQSSEKRNGEKGQKMKITQTGNK